MIHDAAVPSRPIVSRPEILKGGVRKTEAAQPTLSIIVPTKNEADNVGKLITRIERATTGIPLEVIFVDDSTDQTPDVISKIAEHRRTRISLIHRPPHPSGGGLGGAVVEGMRTCLGQWVCVIDADLQHPPELLAAMLERAVISNCDIVIASRYLPGGSAQGLGTPIRKLVSQAARWLAKALFPERLWSVSDPCSGFFLFRSGLVNGIELRPVGFKILTEILVRAAWERVEEIAYRFENRGDGRSKATLAQGLGFLKHLARLWSEVPSAGRFWKFALVGVSGAIVNLGLLSILVVWMGVSRWLGWAAAVEGSILWNFVLAKNFAWADRQSHKGGYVRALSSYHMVAGVGLAANALVFGTLGVLDAHVLLAGTLGILAGMVTNYFGFDKLVFRAPAPPPHIGLRRLDAESPRSAGGGLGNGTGRETNGLWSQVDGHERRATAKTAGGGDELAAPGGTPSNSKKASLINWLIQVELKHIPRANRGSTQNELRMLYNFHRRRHLAIDPGAPAQRALFAAMQTLKGESAVVSPLYDLEFFRNGGDGRRWRNGKEAS